MLELIENEDSLVRDDQTKALVDIDNTKYIERKKQKDITFKNESRLRKLEREIIFLKKAIEKITIKE